MTTGPEASPSSPEAVRIGRGYTPSKKDSHIRFNFCTGGTEGVFGLFNGFLIAVKQCDGSTSFDKGGCCRSPDPVAAAHSDSYLPIKAKTFKHLFSQIGSTPKSATCGHLAERNRKHVKHVF
jgi:hypothetical protein